MTTRQSERTDRRRKPRFPRLELHWARRRIEESLLECDDVDFFRRKSRRR